MNERNPHDLMDMVTLGERGQIVIPAAIRERFQLQAGDKLAIFVKFDKVICLLPPDALRDWVDEVTRQLSRVEHLTNNSSKHKDTD